MQDLTRTYSRDFIMTMGILIGDYNYRELLWAGGASVRNGHSKTVNEKDNMNLG